MKSFKKIYIEITNSCNLNCSFCIGNKRQYKFMSFSEFKIVLDKIKPYTNYIYLHVLGEPLMHPDINKFIEYAYNEGFNVNITTNGYLIDRLNTDKVRQINISLHSYNGSVVLSDYLNKIFLKIDEMDNTYFSLRVWVKNMFYDQIIDYLSSKYGVVVKDNFKNVQLKDNVYLNEFHEFIWPDINNGFYSESGKCYGLIDHIGILSDGTIVPCCLDSEGIINLGNIFKDDLSNVLESSRVNTMISGFKIGKKCEELCRHCSFLDV